MQNQAKQLVLSNMQDCLASAKHLSDKNLGAIGREIASPGTFTAAGLDVLNSEGADLPWVAACDTVLQKLHHKT